MEVSTYAVSPLSIELASEAARPLSFPFRPFRVAHVQPFKAVFGRTDRTFAQRLMRSINTLWIGKIVSAAPLVRRPSRPAFPQSWGLPVRAWALQPVPAGAGPVGR